MKNRGKIYIYFYFILQTIINAQKFILYHILMTITTVFFKCSQPVFLKNTVCKVDKRELLVLAHHSRNLHLLQIGLAFSKTQRTMFLDDKSVRDASHVLSWYNKDVLFCLWCIIFYCLNEGMIRTKYFFFFFLNCIDLIELILSVLSGHSTSATIQNPLNSYINQI